MTGSGPDLVAGVDSSTRSCEVELCRLGDGAVVGTGSAPHPSVAPPSSEQRPNQRWRAFVLAFKQRCLYDFVSLISGRDLFKVAATRLVPSLT